MARRNEQPQKSAKPRAPGVSPISGTAPPKEHQFKPGNCANPGGRPKGRSITALLNKILDEKAPGGDKTIGELVARQLIRQALGGKNDAIKELLDRTEGKATQKVEGQLDANLTVRFHHPDGTVAEMPLGKPPR